MAIHPEMHECFDHSTTTSPQHHHGHHHGRRRRPRRRPRADSLGDSSESSSSEFSASSSSSTASSISSSNSPQFQRRYRKQPQNAEPTPQEQAQFVAMDCEMVGVGEGGRKSQLARVTMVDWHGSILLDEYVQPVVPITDYRTFVSGITADYLLEAHALVDIDTCRNHVQALLRDKILVGHGLKNDLRVLGIGHPWHQTRDTAKYEPFMKVRFVQDGILWPRSLKELCHEKLNKSIQTEGTAHCPVEDAVAALDLYRSVRVKWEKCMAYKLGKTLAIQQQQQQKQQQ